MLLVLLAVLKKPEGAHIAHNDSSAAAATRFLNDNQPNYGSLKQGYVVVNVLEYSLLNTSAAVAKCNKDFNYAQQHRMALIFDQMFEVLSPKIK